jgi:hypothetical protein
MNESLEGIKVLGAKHRFEGLLDDDPKFTDHGSMVTTSDRNIRVLKTLTAVIRCVVIGE